MQVENVSGVRLFVPGSNRALAVGESDNVIDSPGVEQLIKVGALVNREEYKAPQTAREAQAVSKKQKANAKSEE